MSDFATRLRVALNNKGWKPAMLAYKLGLERGTIYNYLNGRYKPKRDLTIKIAEVLEVSPAWLHCYDIEQENPAEEPALSDGEKVMLDLFRNASPYQQEMILRMLEAAVTPKE